MNDTPLLSQLAVLLIVTLAFTSETALGFGSTIIAVALGSFFLPLDVLLAAFVPVNVLLSVVLVARTHAHAELRLLGLKILPWVLLGLPLGIYAGSHVREAILKSIFGVFVLTLAALELRRSQPAANANAATPTAFLDRALLTVAGVVHGAFATGGPMVVFVLGRTLGQDKARFRATLSVLWLVLNSILLVSFLVKGRLTQSSGLTSALFGVSMLAGFAAGEIAFRRVSAVRFRLGVFAMLGLAGALMLMTNLGKLWG